jgi:nucleotide-binding universal stress UspA family protein
MCKRILVPLDGSAQAEAVLPYARQLAKSYGAELVLFRVAVASPLALDPVVSWAGAVEEARNYVVDLTARQRDGEVKIIAKARWGDPVEEILAYVDEGIIDLITMTTHGRSGLKRWVLGSVAENVLRRASVPVLLVRAPEVAAAYRARGDMMMEVRHILAPTDFSEFSKKAIDYAFGLAQQFGAKLSLLHVIGVPAFPIEGFVPPGPGTKLLEDLERQARLDLAHMLPQAEAAKVDVTRLVVMGTPYRKIVETAEAEKADFIVMATHGRTGLSHMLIGSVAERVVRTAPCPVLTLRLTVEPEGGKGEQA